MEFEEQPTIIEEEHKGLCSSFFIRKVLYFNNIVYS